MIEIAYDLEKVHLFRINYLLIDYIPESMFREHPQNTELHFIKELFDIDSNIKYLGEMQMIWSTYYKYKLRDMDFSLVLDEDYDLVSYVVDDSNNRIIIAEYILELISKKAIR